MTTTKKFRTESEAQSFCERIFPNCASEWEGRHIRKTSIEYINGEWVVEIVTE